MVSITLLATVAAVTYSAYSWAVYRGLQGSFQRMRLVAAARPEASDEDAGEAATALMAVKHGLGEELPGVTLDATGAEVRAQLQRLLACESGEIDEDGLLGLAAGDETRVVEEVSERLCWQTAIRACGRRRGDTPATAEDAEQLLGTWRFCFRDYVNEEELAAMAGRRYAFTPVRLRGATRLSVSPAQWLGGDMVATLQDRFALLGFVPVSIEWRGRLHVPAAASAGTDSAAASPEPRLLELRWDDTSLTLGWKRFSRTLQRPPAAERLRHQPWELKGAFGGESQQTRPLALALCRRGIGTLVFCRV